MAVTIIANGFMGTLKQQRVSTNTTNTKLSDILNNANIIPPVTNEPNKVFSYWATTISGFDIGDYTISQLYSIGAITKDNILNIYANFTYVANSIQVTFNTNGGTFPDGSTSKVITTTMGSIYGELESSISVLPTKSGSYFLKWTDPKNNTVNGSYEFTESVVITAQYSASANTSIVVKDSRSKPVISGSFPKLTLWRDLYAKAISNGYKPDDIKKVFSSIKPGYGSYTGQAIKSIDFSVANNPMKIGWLRGSIYEAANADVSLYTNRNLAFGTNSDWNKVSIQSGWGVAYLSNPIYEIKDGETYTVQVEVRNMTSQIMLELFSYKASGAAVATIAYKSYASDDKKIVVTFTAKLPEGHAYLKPNLAFNGDLTSAKSYEYRRFKIEVGSIATPWTPAPEDINKKIRDFSSTTVPVDPSTTFAVTGKATNPISLTHNPIGLDEYWTNRNLFIDSKTQTNSKEWFSRNGAWNDGWGTYLDSNIYRASGPWENVRYSYKDLLDRGVINTTDDFTYSIYFRVVGEDPAGMSYSNIIFFSEATTKDEMGTVPLTSLKEGQWTRIIVPLKFIDVIYDPSPDKNYGYSLRVEASEAPKVAGAYYEFAAPMLNRGTTADPYQQAPEDTKPGLWLNDNWLYNPYTQKWLDTPIDNTDYSYSNLVITFKDYFNVQYVTGDISKVRSSVTATVKSVVAGYGSTTDRKALYDNSYFPSDDSGVTLNVEEYLGFSYVVFYNPSTGYSQKIYQQAGTPYSEFLKGITRSKFEAAGKYLKGFYVSNYWTNAKLIASNPINSPIDLAVSDYLLQLASSFTTVFFNANGGVFYRGTSYETQQISVDVSKTDTYSIVSGYIPEVKKRTLGLLYWALDLEHMEPAYPNTVVDQSTVFAKWSIIDNIELYRKPREYYLVDASTITKGWDQMDKFSISDKNNIFVIDPEGNGATYDTASTYTSNGWGSAEQELKGGTLSFDAYYNGYSQYNRLGRWMRGKELAMVRLDETGIPTYWMVKPAEIERTEIKYNEQYLKGKLSFTKLSPPFDLEFIGIGTDNIIDNEDNMFRRNSYVYIHSLKVPGPDNGVQIIAQNSSTTIEDSVAVDLPTGSYFEYSTIPFKERWKYGPTWSDMPNNLYNNIVNLAVARPIILGIGKWELSVSSSNITTINSLSPHKIQDYAGKTIDSLGGLGPFMGIAIKEKEL